MKKKYNAVPKKVTTKQKRGRKPRNLIVGVIETGFEAPKRTYRDLEELKAKIKKIIPQMEPLKHSTVIPTKRQGSIRAFLNETFPKKGFTIQQIADNPDYSRVWVRPVRKGLQS